MRILFTSPEVFPFAKTGGLADAAASLAAALARAGHDVKIVMPKYGVVDEERWGLKLKGDMTLDLGDQLIPFAIWTAHLPGTAVPVFFLGNEDLFDRRELYQEKGEDYTDNLERFSAFSRAVLELPRRLGWFPDVLHAHDWQTALTLAYLRTHLAGDLTYRKTGTLFTVHNLGYAGLFPAAKFPKLGLPHHYFTPNALEFYGKVNLLKAGLVYAGILNTVSPTYSREIQTREYGMGLEGVLQSRRQDLFGIVNGVDYQKWDPAHDPYIAHHYDGDHLEGKCYNKAALQQVCGLPRADVPLAGVITRLTRQKGVDLILDAIDELAHLDLQWVFLGAGDPALEQGLKTAARKHSQRLSVHLKFDEALAHRIEAGADLFVMPSRYEPCGLNQLYSLRYGTIPLARKTGGLADTVTDATPSNLAAGTATGLLFETPSGHALLNTIRLALYLHRDRRQWTGMMSAAMRADFSWDRSVKDYLRLYELAVNKARGSASKA